jgi:hypothetical protein
MRKNQNGGQQLTPNLEDNLSSKNRIMRVSRRLKRRVNDEWWHPALLYQSLAFRDA